MSPGSGSRVLVLSAIRPFTCVPWEMQTVNFRVCLEAQANLGRLLMTAKAAHRGSTTFMMSVVSFAAGCAVHSNLPCRGR